MGTMCTCKATRKKPTDGLDRMIQGSILVKDFGKEYIVAQVESSLFLLIGLDSGNRWSDGRFSLKDLRKAARRDGFKLKVADVA